MDGKTISLNDVYIAYSSSKPTLYKAIANVILTSNMTPTILSKLTLNDFLKACEDYFDDGEEKNFSNLLKKDPWTIIPTWKIDSENIITFNTPEATFHIFLYLKEKRSEDLDNLENPLFKSGKNNFLPSNKISSYVTSFNSILKLFYEDYQNKFNSKNLIKTFKAVYDIHMNLETTNKDNLLKLFEGKLAKNSKFYKNAMENTKELKEYYMMLIPFLTVRIANIENELKIYNKYVKDKQETHEIINNYYYTRLKDKLNLKQGQEQLLLKFAQDISKNELFFNSPIFMENLFKKAMIRLKLHNHDFKKDILSIYGDYVEKNSSPEAYAQKIEQTISDLKVYNLVKITEMELYILLNQYIVKNEYYDKDLDYESAKKIIEDVLFKIIDEDIN